MLHFQWPNCVIEGCPNKICLGASALLCYPHTLQWLILEQVEAINALAAPAPDKAIEWLAAVFGQADPFENTFHMEHCLVKLAEMEMNYSDDPCWLSSAKEILERIEQEDD